MKKFSKIYLPLLILLVTLLCVLGLSACGDDCEHVWKQGVTVNAGCEHEGAIAYTCEKCGEIKTELIDPKGHSFTNYVDDNNATCEQEGTKTAKCDNEDCEKTNTLSVPKRHVFSDSWTQSPDGHYHACTVCGASGEVEPHDESGFVCSACGYNTHVHNAVKAAAKAPTCSATGNVEYWYCPECEGYYLDEALTEKTTVEAVTIATLPHNYTSVWFNDAEGHWHQCEDCSAIDPDSKAAHISGGAATADTDEICTVCNYIITPAGSHTHSSTYVAASGSTCTANGTVECWYCEGCQKYFADAGCTTYLSDADRIIPAAHSATHVEALEPTCFVAGYIEHWYCSACDSYFTDAACAESVEYVLIAKPAPSKHIAITWVAGVPGGCEKDGNIAYWYCSACDKYYTDSAYTNEVTKADTLIAKTGHNPAYVGGKAATCTEKGNREYWNCTNCNKNYTSVDCSTIFNLADLVIDALGHKQAATPDSVIDPTCLAGGYSIFSCDREGCGHKIKNNYTPVGECKENQIASTGATCQSAGSVTYQCEYCKVERVIWTAKSDHNYETTVVEPTCSEAGYTRHTCKTPGCGYSYKDAEVASSGHNWSETRVEPGCTTPGSITTSCSGCGEESVEAIPALGHDAAPTCEASDECSRCDYVAPATGHNYRVAELKAATCTENGYVKYTCSNAGCEKPEITDYPAEYNATGHAADPLAVWTETEVAVDGEACAYQVVRTAPCAACGETIETRGDKYTEHKIVVSIKTSATCSVPGVKVHTCSVCNEVIDGNVSYSDPEAHAWGEGVLQADGITTLYTCACGITKTSVSAKESTEAKVDSETVKNSDDVELKNATFVPDSDIKDTLTGEVEFGAEAKDKSEFDLDSEVLDRIGNNPIYDFTMTVDGTPATNLGGTMTVRIPYDLGDEDPENIMVWYIEGENLTEVKATYVEIDGQGYAVFETTHFSYYTVTKMKPAERCKLYGHNIRDIEVPATCLTDGYVMHVCTRCGVTEADSFVEALGHDFICDEETYVARTCSVNGYAEYACSRCGVGYVVRENATGHDWVKNSAASTVATCESTGVNVYQCSGCEATKEEYAPALAHNYRTVVKNPTCTADGYTEKVCRDCGFTDISARKSALGHNVKYNVVAPTCIDDGYTESYCARCDKHFENSSIVKSNGSHVWNLENASCTEDMVCIACGTRSAKATGHSFGTNGVCENAGCNEKCAHEYSYLKDVEATCTKRAHKLHQCSICFGTKEVDYVGDPIPHDMENGVCKVCGLSSSTYYLAMLQSWKNVDGFALRIEDFSFSMEELVEDESPWYAIIGSADMKLAELMIYIDENGNLAGAANGALTVVSWEYGKQTQIYSVNAVIENGNVYIEMTQTLGDHGASETYYVSVTVEYIIGAILEETSGLKREGIAEIVKYLDEKLLPILEEYVEVNASDIDEVIESLINLVFSEEETEDGYVYVLDFNKINEINNDLAYLSIAEFVDKYFGESSFDELVSTIKEIAGTKLSELPALLDSYGFDSAKIIALVNEVAAASGAGEGFDIEAMLNSDDMKDVPVAALICEGGYEEFESIVDELDYAFKNASLYDLIAGENKEIIREGVSEILEEYSDVFYFSFTTNAARSITSLNLSVVDFSMEIYEDEKVNFSISVEFIPNGRINVSFDSIIEEINSSVKYPELDPLTENDFEFKNLDGEFSIVIDDQVYRSMQTLWGYAYKYSLDFSNPIGTMVMGNCGTKYYSNLLYAASSSEVEVMVYMLENGWIVMQNVVNEEITKMYQSGENIAIEYPDGSTKEISMNEVESSSMSAILLLGIAESWYGEEKISYSNVNDLYIYYDKATGEYEIVSYMKDLHNYELDESKTTVSSECGSFSYYHYVCSECGHSYGEYRNNYHSSEWKCVLVDGATSCEEGLVRIEYCTKCDKVLYTYEYEESYHETFSTMVWDEEKNALYSTYECACGKESGINHEYTVDFDGDVEFGDVYLDHTSLNDVISFTVSESGIYQFYGKNTGFSVHLYDADGNYLNVYGATSDKENVGMGGSVSGPVVDNEKPNYGYVDSFGYSGKVYELVAGETYYASIYKTMYSDSSDRIITIDVREFTEYSLADYGCTCGATMTVYNEFGRDNVSFSECSCGLEYGVTEIYGVDDECREIIERIVIFYTENGEETFLVSTYFTGNFQHDGYGRWTTTRTEAVGDDGQLVILESSNYYTVCDKCGNVTYKESTITTYEKKSGRELGRKYESYVLNRDGELTLERTEANRYAVINYLDGTSETKCIYTEYFYYNRTTGEPKEGNSYAYTYHPENKCLVTVVYTDYSGKSREYTEFDHAVSEKLIIDESGETEIVDAYGRRLTVVTEARESYCTICYASITKSVYRVSTSEDGSYRKVEREYYEQFAISADVYGYVLREAYAYEYGYAVGIDGRTYEYTLSDYSASYSEGELDYWYKSEYKYNYGDFCHYDRYYANIYSPELMLQGQYVENHRSMDQKLELLPGSSSCDDGLARYYVCNLCGYSEYEGDVYDYGHNTYSGNATVYNLSDFGSVCGGTVRVYSCPCGKEKRVEIDRECDFETRVEYISLENGYGYKYTYSCAVTDPLCGFSYTEEYRYYAIENCKEYYEKTYDFGNGFVISFGYETGSYRHNIVGGQSFEREYYEDGYRVHEYEDAELCINCGLQRSSNINKHYYDANTNELVKKAYIRSYYNDQGILSSYEETEYHIIKAMDGKNSNEFVVRSLYRDYNEYGGVRYENVTEYDRYNTYCPYSPIVTYYNSYGDYSQYQEDHYEWCYTSLGYDPAPTCTQKGLSHEMCMWCGDEKIFEASPYDHRFSEMWDEESGEWCYVCYRCGLESVLGNNGSLSVEDLSNKFGNGSEYVVGYLNKTGLDFIVAVSLIVDGGEDLIDLDVYAYDDGSKVYVSIYDIIAAIEAVSGDGEYSICKDAVRVTFVPIGGSDFDYSITFDPHVLASETVFEYSENNGLVKMHTIYCTLCDYRGGQEDCNISSSYEGEYYVGTCRDCGLTYRERSYTVNDGCDYYNRRSFERRIDGEWVLVYDRLDEQYRNHSFYYTFLDLEKGEPRHRATCRVCGEEEYQTCWSKNDSREDVVIDGITHTITNFVCECGYEYSSEGYWVLKNADACYYEYVLIYSYAPENVIISSEKYAHKTTYSYDDAMGAYVSSKVCSSCGNEENGVSYITLDFVDGIFSYEVVENADSPSAFTLKLVAEKNVNVMFSSYNSDIDTWGAIYNADHERLVYSDDYYGRDFGFVYQLEAGETYYLVARPYSEGSAGKYTVSAQLYGK